MGEIADALVDDFIDRLSGQGRHQRPGRKGFQKGVGNFNWRVSSGVILDMRKMTTDHILNCMLICDQYNNTGKKEQFQQVLDERAKNS